MPGSPEFSSTGSFNLRPGRSSFIATVLLFLDSRIEIGAILSLAITAATTGSFSSLRRLLLIPFFAAVLQS